MLSFSVSALALSQLLVGAQGFAVLKRGAALPDDFDNHPWIPATIDQERSPCPGLNTLANHGYLPRDGRFISEDDLNDAFSKGFGIDKSVIKNPTANAFSVCRYVVSKRGEDPDKLCATTFNLTNLNEPHTFEHDHSMSRQDYKRLFTTEYVDNHDFNRTVWGDSLSVFQQRNLMNVNDCEQIRLDRESLAYQRDPRSWFTENRNTMLNEMGFVFAVMRNFESERRSVPAQSSNEDSDQIVHVDWWSYWFSKERFPVELGWKKPVPDVKNEYVLAISASIFSATVTNTPSPLPSEALLQPTTNPITPATKRNAAPTDQTEPVATFVNAAGLTTTLPASLVKRAEAMAAKETPKPPALQPYKTIYQPEQFASYQSSVDAYQSGVNSAMNALATNN